MAQNHVVQEGECLSRIAWQYGFKDYATIYEDPLNQELRKKRPDPHLLHPGDVVAIPDKNPKEQRCSTGAKHVFEIRSAARMLRLTLRYADGDPVQKIPYRISGGEWAVQGTTDGDGLLKEKIPPDLQTARLEFLGRACELKLAYLNPVEDTPDGGISAAQGRLQNLGFYRGPVDGRTSDALEAAVRAFQRESELPENGSCDEQTLQKMKQLHGR